MPVPTDQLAADTRESNQRLAEAFQELGHRIEATEGEASRRLSDAVQGLSRRIDAGDANLTGFQADVIAKLSSIDTNLKVFQEKFSSIDANLKVSQDKPDSIDTNFQVSQVRTDFSFSIARWAVGIAIPIVVGMIGVSFSLAWNAAKIDVLVRQHDELFRESRKTDEAILKSLNNLEKKIIPE